MGHAASPWCVPASTPSTHTEYPDYPPLPRLCVRRPCPEPPLPGFGGRAWVPPPGQGVRHGTTAPSAVCCCPCLHASCVCADPHTNYPRSVLPCLCVRRPCPEPTLPGFGGIPWVPPHGQGVRDGTMGPAAGCSRTCRHALCVRVNTHTDYLPLPLRPASPSLVPGRVASSQGLAALASAARFVPLLSSPELGLLFGVPAGYTAGWYVCVHVSPSGCDHVRPGQQKKRCKCGWDGDVTSARREREGAM